MMEEITRNKAEELLLNIDVVKSRFQQNKKELCFCISLENRAMLLVKYNHRSKEKTYFIKPCS